MLGNTCEVSIGKDEKLVGLAHTTWQKSWVSVKGFPEIKELVNANVSPAFGTSNHSNFSFSLLGGGRAGRPGIRSKPKVLFALEGLMPILSRPNGQHMKMFLLPYCNVAHNGSWKHKDFFSETWEIEKEWNLGLRMKLGISRSCDSWGESTPETNWNSPQIVWTNCRTFQWQFVCSFGTNEIRLQCGWAFYDGFIGIRLSPDPSRFPR